MAWHLQAGPHGPAPQQLQLSLRPGHGPAATRCGSRCNTLRPATPPAGRCCAPLGPPPACSSSAFAASLPAGPALFSRSRASLPAGPASLLGSRCQPAGWPCALRAGSRGPTARTRSGPPLHGSDPSRSFGNEFTPQEANRWSGASSLLIVPRVCVCPGRIANEPAQTPRLPVGPPCRAAWARNPRGAESRLITHRRRRSQ